MRKKKFHSQKHEIKRNPVRSTLVILVCSFLALGLLATTRFGQLAEQKSVYAASDNILSSEKKIPYGVAGMVSVLNDVPMPGAVIKRIGTSCEDVMVGQRFQKVQNIASRIDVSSSMKSRVEDLSKTTYNLASRPKIMSDKDYENMLRIVEAEAGTEDLKGRILIANVIMNRVQNDEFPDNISDVIWEIKNGVAQFSPIIDGSIYSVTVTEKTREAVKEAMEGTDYSEGALFFVQRSAADKKNVSWFDTDLQKLFKHGVHEFFKYPDEAIES